MVAGFSYSIEQEAKWQLLNDMVHAVSYDFAQCRQPTPGTTLSEEMITARITQVLSRWRAESSRDPSRRTMELNDLPEHFQAWLTEALIPFPSSE